MPGMGMTVGLIKALAPKPDPEVIEQSVSDWLDDHPEATTTVQDGSITKAKLDNNLQGTVNDVSNLKNALSDDPISVNIYDSEEIGTAKYYVLASGGLSARWDSVYTPKLEIKANCKYYYSGLAAVNNSYDHIVFFDESNTYIANSGYNLATGNNAITIPAGAKYLAVSFNQSYVETFVLTELNSIDKKLTNIENRIEGEIDNIEDVLDRDHIKIAKIPYEIINPSVTLTDKKDWVISDGVAVRQTGTFSTETSNEPVAVMPYDIIDITIYSRGNQSLKAIIITDDEMNVLHTEDEKTKTASDLESFSLLMPEDAKYILWNNGSRSKPTVFNIYRYNKEIVSEDTLTKLRSIEPSFVTKSATYNVLEYDAEAGNINDSTGVFTPSTPVDNAYFVTDYLPLDSGEHYEVLNGHSSLWEIWYYDAEKKYLNKRAMDYQASGRITQFVVPPGVSYGRYYIRIPNVGQDGTYPGLLKDWAMEVVRSGEKQTGGKYDPYIRLSDESRNEYVFDTRMLDGKTIAIMGDSIAAKSGKLTPEILIQEEDVGVELSAHLTMPDVNAGLVINGHTYTQSEVGTLVTFTPVAADVGKEIGRSAPSSSGGSQRWWELLVGKFNMKYVNASWTGTTMVSYESRGNDPYSYETCAWYDSMINKCGIRVPGTLTRNAPDYIFICRGVNDFSTSHAGNKMVLTDGLFDDPDYTTPDTDQVTVDGVTKYGFKEAYALTIQKLRTAYPTATIICCTTTQFKRNNETAYPPNNGHYTLPQLNAAIREVAEFYECRVCDFAKAYTFETLSTYTADNTHPSNAGHREMFHQAMKTLVESIKYTI